MNKYGLIQCCVLDDLSPDPTSQIVLDPLKLGQESRVKDKILLDVISLKLSKETPTRIHENKEIGSRDRIQIIQRDWIVLGLINKNFYRYVPVRYWF